MKRTDKFNCGYHTTEHYGNRLSWRDNKTGKFVKIPEED